MGLRLVNPPLSLPTEFSLLGLFPRDFHDTIRCELFIQHLRSPLEYEAVSYTWADETGETTLSETITVSERPFLVTRNCDKALRRMLSPSKHRIIWNDCICLDQDDVTNRAIRFNSCLRSIPMQMSSWFTLARPLTQAKYSLMH
ncbi:hypothetical protein F5Y16DRAFT_17870 [Xylariaceae sp. FL0255]|nr:hypothetical protein F5Y16DRAFT_17870 [Xylariaceae sp. FL0255]